MKWCRLSECWVWNGVHGLFAKDWLFGYFPFLPPHRCARRGVSCGVQPHLCSTEAAKKNLLVWFFSFPQRSNEQFVLSNWWVVSVGSSSHPRRGSWLMMEWMMATWMMAAGPSSCYGVWMRMMMKMIMTAPTDNDFPLQRWMQKENMQRNMLKQESSDQQMSPPPKQTVEKLVCSTAAHTAWKSFSAGLTATPSVVTVTHPLQSSSASIQSHWQANNESQQAHQHQHNNRYYHHFLLGTTNRSIRHIFRHKHIQNLWRTLLSAHYINQMQHYEEKREKNLLKWKYSIDASHVIHFYR